MSTAPLYFLSSLIRTHLYIDPLMLSPSGQVCIIISLSLMQVGSILLWHRQALPALVDVGPVLVQDGPTMSCLSAGRPCPALVQVNPVLPYCRLSLSCQSAGRFYPTLPQVGPALLNWRSALPCPNAGRPCLVLVQGSTILP